MVQSSLRAEIDFFPSCAPMVMVSPGGTLLTGATDGCDDAGGRIQAQPSDGEGGGKVEEGSDNGKKL